MYKINYSNLKKGYKFYGAFLAVSLLFILVVCWNPVRAIIKKVSMDSEVKAHDVRVEKDKEPGKSVTYQPTYYYMVDGKEYKYTLAYSTNKGISKMKTKNTIYYDSQNPNDCVSEYEARIGSTEGFLMLFISVFGFVGIKGMSEVKKRIEKTKWLAQNGTLIKGLKYQLVPTGSKVKGKRIMAIQVDYELPSGSIVKLTGDPRYDSKLFDEDGLVDLLIDLNDTNNYYIDFNISQGY